MKTILKRSYDEPWMWGERLFRMWYWSEISKDEEKPSVKRFGRRIFSRGNIK